MFNYYNEVRLKIQPKIGFQILSDRKIYGRFIQDKIDHYFRPL